MRHDFAAMFTKEGPQKHLRVAALGHALVKIEEGLVAMRHAAAPAIARREQIPLDAVRDALELSIPLESPSTLDCVPLEFGAVDPARPGFDLHPQVPALFWRFTARVVREASAGRGELLSANGAEAFVGAARWADEANCGLALAHRQGRREWVQDVDVVRVAPGLQRYAERRRQSVPVETDLVGELIGLTLEPLSFTLRTPSGNVRVRARAKHENELRSLWGKHVVAYVSARINREGTVQDAVLADLRAVISARSLRDHFRATSGKDGGMWSTPEAREYIASLRDPEPDN